MGRIPCPWGGCGTFHKGEVELTDHDTGEQVVDAMAFGRDVVAITKAGVWRVAAEGAAHD